MDREQEEAVLRIAARYVAEVQAGQQPRLSDYLSRYPQYADAIADFVAYYHAIEADVPGETQEEPLVDTLSPLSDDFHIAIDSAWKRISQLTDERISTNKRLSLREIAKAQKLTLSQLAGTIGLSVDVIMKIDQHRINASTIAGEVFNRLASALHQPLDAIRASVGGSNSWAVTQVAESPASYDVGEQPGIQAETFREAVESSTQLSDEQKAFWHDILSYESL
jgi:transcriptional regulator with XRE-family HTH domain